MEMVCFTSLLLLVLLNSNAQSTENSTVTPRRPSGPGISQSRNDDFCDRQLQLTKREINISDALRGATISVVSGLWEDVFLKKEGSGYSGFEIDLLLALQQRAGFNFTLTMHPPPSGVSWGTWLFFLTRKYDLVTFGYWQSTKVRANRGVVTPDGFIDASYTMVVLKVVKEEESDWDRMVQCFFPLKEEVWGVAIALMVVTGFVYFIVERKNPEEFPEGVHAISGVETLFKGCLQVTGGGGYTPTSWPGKLILASWSWFVVLFLAAYTANLASYLVVQNVPQPQYTSLSDAMQKNAMICIEGGQIGDWFERRYPHYAKSSNVKFIPEAEGDGFVTAQYLGTDCDVIIVLKFVYEQKIKHSPVLNKDCKMEIVGEPLQMVSGGWMVNTDYDHRCTALVKDALAYWFLDMELDGSLDRLYGKLLPPGSDCKASSQESQTDHNRLDLQDMSGTFYVHIIVLVVSLALYFIIHGAKHSHKFVSNRLAGTDDAADRQVSPSEGSAKSGDTSEPGSPLPLAKRMAKLENGTGSQDHAALQSIQSQLDRVEKTLSNDISELSRNLKGLEETMNEVIKYVNLKVRV